jgi:O-antigen/teichoic acid export membrane protein
LRPLDTDRVAEALTVSPFRSARAELASGAAARLAATAVDAVTGLVAVALSVRLLGVSSYGVLAFMLSVVSLLAGLSRAGWGIATTRTVSERVQAGDREAAGRAAAAAVRLAVVTAAVGAAVVVAVSVLGGGGRDRGTALAVGAGLGTLLAGTNLAWATAAVARGLGRVPAAEAPMLVLGIVRLAALAVVWALARHSLGLVSLAYGLAGATTAGVAALLARRFLRELRPAAAPPGGVRRLLGAAAPFAVQGLASLAITRFDVLVLGLVASSATVGAYEPTLRATERLMQLAPLLGLAQFLPVATRLVAGGDVAGFRDVYRGVTKVCYAVTMLGAIALVAFPERVLTTLYGSSFPAGAHVPWILVAGYLPYAALSPSWVALAASDERRALIEVSGISLATMVVAAVALIPPFGMTGAAAATAVSVAVQQIASARALRAKTGVHAFDRRMVTLVVTSAAVLAVAALVHGAAHGGAARPSLAAAALWSLALWAAWAGTAAAVFRGRLPGRWGVVDR